MSRRRYFAVALMALALILVSIGAVNAQLITTNILRSYDDALGRYENGNLTMFLNNDRQPFYTQLDFNNDPHADACGVGTNSQWAGDATIGLYHTDNLPDGAQGFQNSGNWQLVKCSTFTDPNTGLETIKYPAPADVLATCIPGQQQDGPCVLIGPADVVVNCSTGNCTNEIETTFHLNIDHGDGVDPLTKCDGTIDAPFAGVWSSNPSANNLCLYWDAQKPANVAPYWGGNIQVRYGVSAQSGGDKTINFNTLLGPNAVSMSSISAVAEANSASLAMWAGALGLAAAALWLWRKRSVE
jgi:hypothetical protein